MTEAQARKANFIDGEMQNRYYSNGEKFSVEDVEYAYDIGFSDGSSEVTYMKADDYSEYIEACRETMQLKKKIEEMKCDLKNLDTSGPKGNVLERFWALLEKWEA